MKKLILKPYARYEPVAPKEIIEQHETVHTVYGGVLEYSSIKEYGQDFIDGKIKLNIYSDSYGDITIELQKLKTVKNNSLKKELKEYGKKLEQYKKEKIEYESNLIAWEAQEKAIKIENIQKQVKNLENATSGITKLKKQIVELQKE